MKRIENWSERERKQNETKQIENYEPDSKRKKKKKEGKKKEKKKQSCLLGGAGCACLEEGPAALAQSVLPQ